ncbi:hypothetical protein Acsp06_49620 [Actinomycetospora sp. NBRC 106375]|uniref:hypothetical protein n=1 Tax=Actinomycetospora sp. NBRC 106375 TaxID=3032207 RepID=UPI0024A517DF|nr:hypothetical protein [Actinomycetospora sp. NBRC 106375]GLZ48777.1 hypothetical protein Acsp06_49620 [Actinomycetospora sp. NBRC 106375]
MSAPTADQADLGEIDGHLSAVLEALSAPPADRDPLLWAAHEAALCARELLAMRTGGDEADWASVLASARASMAAVSYARREAGS